MWERSQANPQLRFDVGLELQHPGNSCLLGFVSSRARPSPVLSLQRSPGSSQVLRTSVCSRISDWSGVDGSYWGVLEDVFATYLWV